MEATRNETDHVLLGAYVGGGADSSAAFEELVRRHGAMVHQTCLRMLGSEPAAEDAAQAVFMVLARRARSVRGNLPAFLHGVAQNMSRCQLRSERLRKAREKEIVMRSAGRAAEPSAAVSDWETIHPEIDRAIGGLPDAQREAVVLHYLQGRSQRETALELGISEEAASIRITRALGRLRALLSRRRVSLGTTALTAALSTQTGAASGCPMYLMAAAKNLASAGLGLSAAGISGNVTSLAKGAMQMMFWAKVKVAAVVFSGVLILGGGVLTATRMDAGEPTAAAPVKPGEFRREKDFAGREWTLTDWKEGERPYKKNLAEREAEYRKRWGEDWAGVESKPHIFSPGTWRWEDFAVIPKGRICSPGQKNYIPRWGGAQAVAFAPGGGEEVDAVYVIQQYAIFHIDPKTKEITHVGVREPKYHWAPRTDQHTSHPDMRQLVWDEPEPDPLRDGLGGNARVRPSQNQFGNWVTVCPITGRVFFAQSDAKTRKGSLRYVEKLLSYKLGGREMLLPAILDYKEMYKKLGAEPVMVDGKRAGPRLAVRTVPLNNFIMCGFGGQWGSKIALTPDGKATLAFASGSIWPYVLGEDKAEIVEIDTGRVLGVAKVSGPVPVHYVADAHEAACGPEIDGLLYCCRHPGCGSGPGRLFSLDPKTGKITRLYDSLMAWPSCEYGGDRNADKWREFLKMSVLDDGPADAITLRFITTCTLTQCPRTGATISGGWDGHGLRYYHDGFVTTMVSGEPPYPRPEWNKAYVANFNSLQCNPGVAPNGDIYLIDNTDRDLSSGALWGKIASAAHPGVAKVSVDGDILVLRLARTDWPKEQPVNGYANQFMSPEKREELMLEYCKKYIANYAELSKIY